LLYSEPSTKGPLFPIWLSRSEGPTFNSPIRQGGDLGSRLRRGPKGRHNKQCRTFGAEPTLELGHSGNALHLRDCSNVEL
jgi:hypothetical protein